MRTQVVTPRVTELSLPRAGKGKERDIAPLDVSEYAGNAEFNVPKMTVMMVAHLHEFPKNH